ncbi:MAG: hypothetical protein LBJ90_03210 [Treponema sp.]|jgi:hypothetical protein|nr:hypothetical protein [Treponema sp.]
MARGISPIKIIGILLLAAGLVVLVMGIYQFVEFHQSAAGKIAGGANRAIRALGGSGKMAKGYQQPVILMICGVVGAAAGVFIYRKS